MYNKQILRALLNERLSETAEDIFQLFEQAAAEYQREIDRLKNVSEAKPVEAAANLSLEVAQQTLTPGEDELTDSVLNEEKAAAFPCKVKTEQCMSTLEDEPQLLITNVKSLSNGEELQPHEQQKVNSEGPEEQASGGAETDNSPGSRSHSEEEKKREKNMISCPVPSCKKCFPQIKGVKMHMRRVHQDKKALYFAFRKSLLDSQEHSQLATQCSTKCGGNVKSKLFLRHRSPKKQQAKTVSQGEGAGAGSLISNAKQDTEQAQTTQEDKSQIPFANVNCVVSGDEIQSQNANDERPEEQASGGAETDNNAESRSQSDEEDSDDDKQPFRTKAPKNLISCPVCMKRFPQKRGVKMHMRRVHPDRKALYFLFCKSLADSEQQALSQPDILCKSFSCTVCSRRFKLQSDLEMHMREHAEEKPGTCPECGASFPNQTSINNHMCHAHSTDMLYKCLVCSKPCKSLTALKTHMRVHTGEKPFMCSVCGRRFARIGHLRHHELTHTREQARDLFKCTKCSRKFMKEVDFSRHMKSAHSTERPFKCSFCNLCCKTSSAYKTHKLIHTGEKPCKCSVCGKAFIQRANLTRHMLTHTGQKRYSCSKCGKKYTSKQNVEVHRKMACH